MRRALAALALLAAPLAGARADEPELVGLSGVPVAVRAPAGEWTKEMGSPVPGQWGVTWRAKDDEEVLQIRLFPVKGVRDPAKVLPQAVDALVRGLGTDGFGLGAIASAYVATRPAATAPFTAVVGGAKRSGIVRVLLANDALWAMAWGMWKGEAKGAAADVARAFVESLEPTGPRFHEPRFEETGLDEVVLEVPGEEPITKAHLAAALGLTEIALGSGVPLSDRPAWRDALVTAARGNEELRAQLRQWLAAVREAEGLVDDMRRSALQNLGRTAFGKLRLKVIPRVAGWEDSAKMPGRSRGEAGLRERFAALDVIEWAAFLSALALDSPVELAASERVDLLNDWERWKEGLSTEEQDALRAMDRLWSNVRHAWDHATPEARFAFRREAIARLAHPDQRQEVGTLATPEALRAWMDRRPAPERSATLRAAVALRAADRKRILDAMPVRDEGFRLGW